MAKPATSLLQTFPNPSPQRDYVIRHIAPEFTSRCPITGQPDFGTMIVDYTPEKLCVELKSLKLYLQSFRDEGTFYEAVTNRILDDLVAVLKPRWIQVESRWRPRGGLRSAITVTHEQRRARKVARRVAARSAAARRTTAS